MSIRDCYSVRGPLPIPRFMDARTLKVNSSIGRRLRAAANVAYILISFSMKKKKSRRETVMEAVRLKSRGRGRRATMAHDVKFGSPVTEHRIVAEVAKAIRVNRAILKMKGGDVKVHVKLASEGKCKIKVKLKTEETIDEIKAKIRKEFDREHGRIVPVAHQQLLHIGQEIVDGTVGSNGIRTGTVLTLQHSFEYPEPVVKFFRPLIRGYGIELSWYI